MDSRSAAEATTVDRTTIERTSEQELVVTRTIDGPRDVVFEAWTDAELFRQWWVPKSVGVKLLSCEIDARVGGGYRLTFDNGTAEPMAFFGRYLEVTPPTRLVWTNEEGDEGTVVTTVTFEDHGAHVLKGVQGEWRLHAPTGHHDPVEDALAADARLRS